MNKTIVKLLPSIALDSDDPDTQTSCVIDNGSKVVVTRCNVLPPGVEKTVDRVSRPDKYDWINHAEKAAIAKAARMGYRTHGADMYLNWYPCASCAACISEAGIKVLYCDRQAYEARKDDPRYGFARAAEILEKGEVEVRWLSKESLI